MSVKVKICGITNPEDALTVLNFGADYIGFVLYPPSPRYISPEKVKEEIFPVLGNKILKVAVVVYEDINSLKRLLDIGFDLIQLHYEVSENILKILPAERLIKVFRVKNSLDPSEVKKWEKTHAVLLDTYKKGVYGGTGETFDWKIAKKLSEDGFRIILSGGLNPENVCDGIKFVKPFGVDVSGGVERNKGLKDHLKVKAFIENAKNCGKRF